MMFPGSATALDTAHSVEADLRNLSVAARRQHPMVKEAAERGIIMLRAQKASLHRHIREQVATEGASGHKTGFIAGGEVLTPFVLACNHADASVSILSISIIAIQRLLTNDCIERDNFPNIMRVLRIQALSEHQEVLLKALQTMPLLTTPRRFDVPEDVIRQLFTIAFDLVASERPIIHHTATATLQQMMTLVFDRVESQLLGDTDKTHAEKLSDGEQHNTSKESQGNKESTSPGGSAESTVGTCGHASKLFQDLCLLGKGDRAVWVRDGATPPQTLAFDIIETLLRSNSALFAKSPHFAGLLRSSVCPMVFDVFRVEHGFHLVVRAARVLSILTTHFYELLETELEKFVCILVDSLPGQQEESGRVTLETTKKSTVEGSEVTPVDEEDEAEVSELPAWRCGMMLEILESVVGDVRLVHHIYRTYDSVDGNAMLFQRVVDGISQLVSYAMNGGLYSAWAATDGGSDSDTGSTPNQRRGRTKSKGQEEVGPFIPMEMIGNELDRESAKQCSALDGDNRNKKWNQEKRILDLHNHHHAPHVSIGRIIWRAHICISKIVELFVVEEGPDYYTPKKSNDEQKRSTLPLDVGSGLVSLSWAPLLASLENLLRVCNEIHIIQVILRSYQTYINACGVLNATTPREGFLHSLCAFGLPRYASPGGESVSNVDKIKRRKCRSIKLIAKTEVPLSEKNVQVLEAVFNIAHCLGGILGSSWQVLLEVCEQLNRIFSNATKDAQFLDNSVVIGGSTSQRTIADEESVSILSFALDRLFESSKYLDDTGLHCMIEALGVLAIDSMSRVEFASPRSSPVPSRSVSQEDAEKGTKHHRGYVSAALSTLSRFAGRKAKDPSGHDGRMLKRVQSSNEETEGILSEESIPFAWKKLVVATQINIDRLAVIWELVSGHMETMCANKNEIVRAYGVQSLSLIISDALVYTPVVDGNTSPSLRMRRQDQALPCNMQVVFLQSLEQCFSSGRPDVQEMVLDSVYSIIQNCGQVFDDAWSTVLKLLSLVAKEHPLFVSLGFKSVQLIADDFLETLPVESADKICETDAFFMCIKCLSEFASQTSDVNISLTAIGTLWAVGDYARRLVTSSNNKGEADEMEYTTSSHEHNRANSIWVCVLKELEYLAMDDRGPVRNCALQSMFATLVTHGAHFATELWTACLSPDGIVFSLMVAIERKCVGVESESSKENSRNHEEAYMIVHHSRDTSAKQWNETRVIALQELSRTVRSFFDLLSPSDWFSVTWAEMLSVVRRALLLVREAASAEIAEVQREVVVAAVTVLGDLMGIAAVQARGKDQMENDVQIGLNLWRPTWDTLRELGEVEDFRFDTDEDLSRSVIKALAHLWKPEQDSPFLTTEAQISYFALANRILVNRPLLEGRYRHAKSPTEREFIELIKGIVVTEVDVRATLFQYLLEYSKSTTFSPMFVLDAVTYAVKMWNADRKPPSYFSEIVEVLGSVARRGVQDGIDKVTNGSFDLLVTMVLPEVDAVREDSSALVWKVWPLLLDDAELTLSITTCSTLLLDSIQQLAISAAAPPDFVKAFVSLLKQGSKKDRVHQETCQQYLLAMGEDNDDEVVVEQCEALIKRFRTDDSAVKIEDMAVAMESLLRVSKKALKALKDT